MRTLPYILAYLAAIVAANLIITEAGPEASVVTAFAFIGLDFVARDRLHDAWTEHRWLKMGALILAGSALSYAINSDARDIAIASCVAFGAAAIVDTVVYQFLLRRNWPWLERANASNIPASAVDSIVFPALAFPGPLPWLIVFGQFTAKIGGGLVWSLILKGRRDPAPEAA